MKKQLCPSCKKKLSGKAKKCSKCGFVIPIKNSARITGAKILGIAAIAIIVIALVIFTRFQERAKSPVTDDSPEIIQTEPSMDIGEKDSARAGIAEESPESVQVETLKNNTDGTEFSSTDIVVKFNSFLKDEGARLLSIDELVLESGESEDVYRGINDNIGVSIVSPKGRSAVTSVSVSAERGNEKEFITYSMGLLSVFTPTMKPDVRQRVVFAMMEYTEDGDTPLRDENTYIIVETKYTFTYTEQSGLRMLVEQMPALEESRPGDLPPMIR
ncbi:MAG: hypothetical protein FWF87_06395 [Synergistaceae bacterium]|nr:hypothetical protein [Synergistaceae bacterium]